MNVTSTTLITLAICVVFVLALTIALIKGLWAASRKITIPIQVILFVLMLVCVGRMFFTTENAKKLYDGIEQSGISQNVENTMRSALNLKPAGFRKDEAATAQVADAPVVPPVCEPEAKPAPMVEPVRTAAVEKPARQIMESPVPGQTDLNRGKQNFVYTLPFSAKVMVGFKDGTYRIVVESKGSPDAFQKKEIGKMAFTSLGKYVGRPIESWDKAKIAIESRYDESEDCTRVFVIVPPDAIE